MTATAARRPLARRAFLALLALVALAALGAWLSRSAPAWWSPVARDAPGALDAARALEQGIASETTRVRAAGEEEWSVRVRAADLNAWLGARLPRWLEHDRSLPWPEGVRGAQVRIDAEGIVLAADWNGFVVSTRLELEPGAPGTPAMLRAASTSVGRLPVPFAAGVGAWFVPELARPLALEAALGDGRRLRVEGVEFADGEAIVDCVTAVPGRAASPAGGS